MNTIADLPNLASSVMHDENLNIEINSRRIIMWKCPATSLYAGCGKMWLESVVKRARFERCPLCSPQNT